MASEEHLKQLKKGVVSWNNWRKNNPKVIPDLSEVNLVGVNLTGADLYEADLTGAILVRAILVRAILVRANLSRADLSEADFSRAHLDGADLVEANLSRADLSGAMICGTNLLGANLVGANFREAKLRRAKLRGVDLSGVKFLGADLSRADLSRADLSRANLRETDLRGTDLVEANLAEAKLGGSIINESTIYKKIKGCQIGVNGFWCKETDSAALRLLTPPGNSMQGSLPDAVIESLKQSRRLHSFSMILAGIIVMITILDINNDINFFNLKVPPEKFALFTMFLSIGILSLVGSFMSDALRGSQYLNERKAAMIVGNFPWALSKYAGSDFTNKTLSFFTRLIMSFHVLAYPFMYLCWDNKEWINPWVFVGGFVLLLGFAGWIFIISYEFQKPILFDKQTENARQTEIEKLTVAIREQTKKIDNLFEFLKSPKDK